MQVKIEAAGRIANVTLSETNLRSLLAAFEGGQDARMMRQTEDGVRLIVTVEPDSKHYSDRPIGLWGIHPAVMEENPEMRRLYR